MSALLSITWEPEIRGILTVIIGTVALCGSVYLLLGTNIGVRLGFLVSMAGLFGWMMCMGIIWMSYGIGLRATNHLGNRRNHSRSFVKGSTSSTPKSSSHP